MTLFYQESKLKPPSSAQGATRQKVQSMSLIFTLAPVYAYNAKNSNFGGRDESKDSTKRQTLGDRQYS
jgi:hypothetical protein